MLSNLRRSVQLPKDSIADSIERNVRAAGPLFIVILVLASALLLSHSRGGLLATLVGITVLFSAETVRHGRSNRTRRLVVITVAVLLLLITIGGGSTLQRMMVDDSQEAAGGRAEIYWQTVAGIEGQPWTGAGYGTFETAFSFWGGADDINLGRVDKAHNTYLEFAAEAGLPAFLVMLAILLWINGCCLRSVLLQRRDTILQAVALAVSAQLAAHSFVDFSLQIPAIAVSYALLLGAGFAQSWSDQTAEAAPRIG
jgi:O-antigen ligase